MSSLVLALLIAADPTPTAPVASTPAASAPAPVGPVATTTWSEGFATPESVLVDGDVYLVSNINGTPLQKDNNGFISRLNPDGTVASLKWIEGGKNGVTLHAPKGMGLAKGVLYVADIDTVRMFDAKTGKPKGEVVVDGASFLNDIAIGKEQVYFTDSGLDAEFKPTGKDAVYVLKGKKAVVLLKGDLNRPNGLVWSDSGLLVNSFGSAELFTLDPNSKKPTKTVVATLPKGGLDGVVSLGSDWLVSSWDGSAVFRGSKGGEWKECVGGLKAPADIGYDSKRKVVLVPRFMDNKIEAYLLP